jgi:hypothetical protein
MNDSIDDDFIDELPPIPGAQIDQNRFRIYKPLVYLGLTANCRCCGNVLDRGLYITGGLGPTLIECPRCHAIAHSHRHEWADMSWWQRAGYVFISVFYGGFAFLLVMGFSGWHPKTVCATGPIPPPRIDEIVGSYFPFLAVGCVIALQLARILNSVVRTWRPSRIPQKPSLWSLDLGIQWKFLLVMVVAPRLLLSACVWIGHR